MMDLNEIPSDHGASREESDEEILGKLKDKFEGNTEDSRSKCSEVAEQKYGEVKKNILALEFEISKKNMELDAIQAKVRALEDEKATIEYEIEVLKKKKAAIQGVNDGKMSSGELPLDVWTVVGGEESKIDELMIENKALECEKMFALKEVEDWKQKCKDLEWRLAELERRLRSKNKDDGLNAIREAPINGDHGSAFRDVGSYSHSLGARDGEVKMEGTPCIETPEKQHLHGKDSRTGTKQQGVHVKRQLLFQNERSNDRKIAPATPEGAIDIIDSDDDELHSSHRHGPSLQRKGIPRVTKSVCADSMVGFVDLEDSADCKENILSVPTPKRKRGSKVVFSDDECEGVEATRTKQAVGVDDIEIESEEDDSMPIKHALKRVKGNKEGSDGDEDNDDDDDDDDIPISQLKINRDEHLSQPIAKRTRSCSGSQAGQFTQTQSHPRRRLVKSQQGKESSRADASENNSEMMTTDNVEDNDSIEDDESDSEADSLKSFIDDDSDIEDEQHDVPEDGADHSTGSEDTSDGPLDYREIISRFQRRKSSNSKWDLEGDMLAAFGKDPELCMRAVCALYRQQTADEKRYKESIFQNGRGFSKFDASRGTKLGEFLTDGDPNGNVVKTVKELQEYEPNGVELCRRLAKHYSKQLFEIYKNHEDQFFP